MGDNRNTRRRTSRNTNINPTRASLNSKPVLLVCEDTGWPTEPRITAQIPHLWNVVLQCKFLSLKQSKRGTWWQFAKISLLSSPHFPHPLLSFTLSNSTDVKTVHNLPKVFSLLHKSPLPHRWTVPFPNVTILHWPFSCVAFRLLILKNNCLREYMYIYIHTQFYNLKHHLLCKYNWEIIKKS